MQIVCEHIDQLPIVARDIVLHAKNRKHWIFEGEMGAGKTTTIKAICKILNVTDHVSSPTFSIVNEYKTTDEHTIYHFDFYRLKNEQEALDFGIEEYFDSNNLCLMEWAEKIPHLLPEHCYSIIIQSDQQSRTFILN